MNRALPSISVVVPAYNERHYLRRCLDSLLVLDYPNERLEIIVVNNHSTDGTRAIAECYTPAVRVIDEERQGVVFARIRGVTAARGEIIAFTDADSQVPQDWLVRMLPAFQDASVVGVGGGIRFDSAPFLNAFHNLYNRIHLNLYRLMFGANMAFRTDAYFACGGFSERICFGEDAYLSHQLKKVGKLVMLEDNYVFTSSRRQSSWNQVMFSLKGTIFLVSLLIFQKYISFTFDHIEDRPQASRRPSDWLRG